MVVGPDHAAPATPAPASSNERRCFSTVVTGARERDGKRVSKAQGKARTHTHIHTYTGWGENDVMHVEVKAFPVSCGQMAKTVPKAVLNTRHCEKTMLLPRLKTQRALTDIYTDVHIDIYTRRFAFVHAFHRI